MGKMTEAWEILVGRWSKAKGAHDSQAKETRNLKPKFASTEDCTAAALRSLPPAHSAALGGLRSCGCGDAGLAAAESGAG